MAITELVFPVIKTDEATLEALEREIPVIAKILTDPNPGFLRGFRGWILSEDGRNVRDEYKEFLLFEWQDEASFHKFLPSDQFASFSSAVQPLLAIPTVLQLYETDTSPKDVAVAPVVEIVRVSIASAERSKTAEQVWERMSKSLTDGQEHNITVTYGKSLNLEGSVIVGILGWPSAEERTAVHEEAIFKEGLASLRSLGDVSQIIVDIGPMELPPL